MPRGKPLSDELLDDEPIDDERLGGAGGDVAASFLSGRSEA